MQNQKENIHPNLLHLYQYKQKSSNSWSNKSKDLQISKFRQASKCKLKDKDWRRKIMLPSQREKELDDQLSRMLKSQYKTRECLKTTLSDDKMMHSFVSSANHTLQKYFGEKQFVKDSSLKNEQVNIDAKDNKKREELIEIVRLLFSIFGNDGPGQSLFCTMNEEQLIKVLKETLKVIQYIPQNQTQLIK